MEPVRLRVMFTSVFLFLVVGCRFDLSGNKAANPSEGQPPVSHPRITSVSVGPVRQDGEKRVQAAPGHLFATVHLEHSGDTPHDQYEWVVAEAVDADERAYRALTTSTERRESGEQGFLGTETRTAHPTRVELVFEIPANASIRSLRVPQSIPLTLNMASASKPAP